MKTLLSASCRSRRWWHFRCRFLLEGIVVEKLQTSIRSLWGKPLICRSNDGGAPVSYPSWGHHFWRRASVRETSGWYLWWSGVVSIASTTASLGGVAQRSIDDGRMMMGTRSVVALIVAMAAMTTGLVRVLTSIYSSETG